MMKFFISYLKEDGAVAARINDVLLGAGHKTFFDRHDLGIGVEWEPKIEQEIKDAAHFLLLWSAKVTDRDESYVYKETRIALNCAKEIVRRQFILPIRIGKAEFPLGEVSKYQWRTLPKKPATNDVRKLIVQLLKEIGAPTTPPDRPAPRDDPLGAVLMDIRAGYGPIIDQIGIASVTAPPARLGVEDLISDLKQRIQSIAQSTILTTKQFQSKVEQAVQCFSDWMVRENIVRIIGAGRARLAASIPAHRLAHGGARVYIQGSIVPMPHDIKGGGVIAVSASGRTTTVLSDLRELKRKRTSTSHARLPFTVIGIARHDATEFSRLCDIFIGVRLDRKPNPLQALADTEEYVISMLLDALVVAAGKRAGFDDIKWRLGHENWGATGPYDTINNPVPPLHAPHGFVDD